MRSSARPLLSLVVSVLVPGSVVAGPPSAASSASAPGPGAVLAAAGVSSVAGAIPGTGPRQRRSASPGGAVAMVAGAIPVPSAKAHRQAGLGRLFQADVLVVGRGPLPAGLLAKVRGLPGVVAATVVDAGRITVNGTFVNVLGVHPRGFRPFAAGPTARSDLLWQNVAAGGMAISYTMGSQDRLSLAKPVTVTGARTLRLPVAGFGTVGIGGVDAVVSDAVAGKLGLPRANAIVISAPHVRLDRLITALRKITPGNAAVAALVTQVISGGTVAVTGAAGAGDVTARQGQGLTAAQLTRFLTAAESRVGMPYVWGGAGPATFDCSGLVQWSMTQAGVTMPRVAADQARTGPLVPLRQLQPGDLLFYHTDPTAPHYISHVAIYLGRGLMLQAPEPGMDVQVVRADFGAGFAGAIRVYPRLAAAVAANPAG